MAEFNGNYTQNNLPSELFNAGSGDVRDYNGILYRISNPGNGTRNVIPLTSSEIMQRNATQQKQLSLEAITPAVSSLQASIPETRARYQSREQQLTAEKDPLIERYDRLLAEIRGRETSQVNEINRALSVEMGRRGIDPSSSFVADELMRRTAPLRSQTFLTLADIGKSREADLRSIENDITNLRQAGVEAERNITNTIANMQASASMGSIDKAIQLYQLQKQELQTQLDNKIKEREIVLQEQKAQNAGTSYITVGNDSFLFDPTTKKFIAPPKNTGTGGDSFTPYGKLPTLQSGWVFV